MKKFLILVVSVLVSVSAFANENKNSEKTPKKIETIVVADSVKTVQLTGSVIDDTNQEALVGATVYVGGKKYYSDLDGNFSISDIKPGKYQVKVEFISYKPVIMDVDVHNDENIHIALPQISYQQPAAHIALLQK